MLVVHWTKHNKTASILKNGIHVASRKWTWQGKPRAATPRGVYVFPYTRNRSARGTWRRILKRGHLDRGNYNGFVFRLTEGDFPVLAGAWSEVHDHPADYRVRSLQELSRRYGQLFDEKGGVKAPSDAAVEIIVPRHIAPRRILRVLRDREPRSRGETGAAGAE